jgi:hypothetical protein
VIRVVLQRRNEKETVQPAQKWSAWPVDAATTIVRDQIRLIRLSSLQSGKKICLRIDKLSGFYWHLWFKSKNQILNARELGAKWRTLPNI